MSDRRMLLLCYGNPAREDDGIGPEFAKRMQRLAPRGVQVESNYQLVVEDAALIAEADLVVFVDASVNATEPYSFKRAVPRADAGYMSHSVGPEQLLGLTEELFGRVPESYLLAVRGYSFEMFTEELTDQAESNLNAAFEFLVSFIGSNGDQVLRGGNRPVQDEAGAPGRSGAEERATGG